MKVYRIHITSWTASFRFPHLISGFQPTLPIPPLSTLYGLISAAMGKYYAPEKPEIGYIFSSTGKVTDLETIYQMNKGSNWLKNIVSNVIRREFLVDNDLWLYTQNSEIAEVLGQPYFPLLLGRSGDLASVVEISEITVEPTENLNHLRGTILPFGKYLMAAPIQALPAYFSDTIPRRNIGTKPYYLLDFAYQQHQVIEANGFLDPQLKTEIYWQE